MRASRPAHQPGLMDTGIQRVSLRAGWLSELQQGLGHLCTAPQIRHLHDKRGYSSKRLQPSLVLRAVGGGGV